MTALKTSRHLSLFHRDGALFVYHDLIGYVLEMDVRVYRLLQAFGHEGRELEEVLADSGFVDVEAKGFVDVMQEHFYLLAPEIDETTHFDGLYPVWTPWSIHYAPSDAEVELGIKDRDSGAVRFQKLNALEARLWNLSCGQLTLPQIAEQLQAQLAEPQEELLARLRAKVREWTHSSRQLLKLISEPLQGTSLPAFARSSMPYERVPADADLEKILQPLDAVVDVRDYHKHTIADAEEQFEVEETTLSHMFRNPHPALRGETYAGRFAQQLVGSGSLREDCRFVEVGGGVGWFARRFVEGLQKHYPALAESLDYTILELAPALAASQRKVAGEATGGKVVTVDGDALGMPFADDSVDLLVSNEMIGDLPTARVLKKDDGYVGADGDPDAPGPRAIRDYGLKCADAGDDFWLNTGAYDFLKEIRRVLKPGGAAVLTEFGEKWAYPIPSTHLDHREFSIHFGHLATVAEKLGFSAAVVGIMRFLQFEKQMQVLTTTRTSFELLRELFRTRDVRFEKLAYTEAMFEELCVEAKLEMRWISPLEWQPLGKRVLGLKPKEFKALVLTPPIKKRKKKRVLDL